MNTFMDRVNAIVQQNQIPQAVMPKQEPVYPDAGIGALENVVSGAPRQTEIMGQPHMLAYINPQEEQMLRDAGGAGLPGPDGIPAYWFHSGWGGNSSNNNNNNDDDDDDSGSWSIVDWAKDTWSEITTGGNAVTDTYNSNDTSSQDIVYGDTTSQLALDNNTTIEQIKADNPGIDINNIKAGETINITPNTLNDGESIYTGVTQAELDAGNAMSSNDDAAPAVSAVTADDVAVAAPAQQGTRSDAVDAALVSTWGWTMGADGDAYRTAAEAEAAGSTYDDLNGALTTLAAGGRNTVTTGGRNLDADLGVGGSEATVTASELLNSDNITKYGTTGVGGVILSDDNTTALGQIISGESTASDLQGANIDLGGSTTGAGGLETRYLPSGQGYYVDENGGFVGLVPKETESAENFTEIYDGDVTDFSLVSGDNRDDLYFDLSDPSERLVTGNGVGFTGTYEGVTYTDGYEVKEPLQVEIVPGDNIGASIEGALGMGTTESDETILPGYAGMSQNEFLEEAGSDVRVEEMTNALRGGSDLTLGEVAAGLGYDTVGGFMEELSLRAQGTGTMADDYLNLLVEANLLRGSETFINPEFSDNLKALQDMNGLDRLALENQAAEQGVSVASLLDPMVSAETGAAIPITLSSGEYSVVSDALEPVVTALNNTDPDDPGLAQRLLSNRSDEYIKVIEDGMPDPNNEGYNMAGEPITPGLWMASVAAQELLGLGLDVITVAALGPIAGGAVAFQQGTAEAGAAAANETKAELESLRASGALDHLSDEEFNTVVDTAETQAFYTSGVAGGAVDTLVALTAGGFAPLAKALPTAINSALTGLGVLGAEGVSGGLEQVGVNAAVIKALEDQGIDPADFDKGYLDQVITAAIYETVGGTGASAASTVGSAVQNLSAESGTDTTSTGEVSTYDDLGGALTNLNTATASTGEVSTYDDLGGALTNVGGDTQTVIGSTYDDLGGALTNVGGEITQTNTQGVNTINTQAVTDAEGQTYTVDTAVDANGNTSVTVTNDATNESNTTDVGTGTFNSVNVGTGTSIIVDTSNTTDTNAVNTTVLESGSSLTQTGKDGITGEETTVDDLTQAELDVIGGEGANTTVTGNGDGSVTVTNDLTGTTVVVGSGSDANIVDVVNAVQNNDTSAVTGNGVTNVTGDSETNVTGDSETNVTGDSETNVTGDSETKVTGDSETKVTGDSDTKVTGDSETKVTGDSETKVTGDSDTKVTGTGKTDTNTDGIVDVGTVADAIVDAATTTTVEEPVVVEPPIEEPLNPVADSLINTDNYAERGIYGDFQRRRRGGSGIGSPQYMRRYMSGRIIDEMVRRVENADGTVSYVTPDGRYLNPKDFINTAALGDIKSLKIGSERYKTGTTTTNLTTGETTTTNTT